jgi:hypothetical protein
MLLRWNNDGPSRGVGHDDQALHADARIVPSAVVILEGDISVEVIEFVHKMVVLINNTIVVGMLSNRIDRGDTDRGACRGVG